MANNVDQALVGKAVEQIDRNRLVDLVVQLVNVQSPTCFEVDISRVFHAVMQVAVFRSSLQPIGD